MMRRILVVTVLCMFVCGLMVGGCKKSSEPPARPETGDQADQPGNAPGVEPAPEPEPDSNVPWVVPRFEP